MTTVCPVLYTFHRFHKSVWKLPSDVLNAGDKVTVKVIGIKDGKISLSMKALEEVKEEPTEKLLSRKVKISEQISVIFSKIFNYKSYLLFTILTGGKEFV